MIPSLLAKEVIQGLQAYITTGFETSTPWFAGAFKELVETPGRFYKGPYLSVSLPFQQGNAGRNFFSALETDFPPYHHQQQAWQRLASDRKAKPTLIATGTGSGKTECFLYPLQDHCARHSGAGVKAIVVYPMNALATDQAKRFAATVHGSPGLRGKVRVGLFVGGLEEEPTKSMGPTAVITDKNTLRDDPPDILLTNYKMLDFLLLRPRDQKLWQFNGGDALRYLVVDELHTFDGAQGTDLACLIRRLKARLLPKDSKQLICVGTSATLGSSDEQDALVHYASQVFQSAFDKDSIIGETRQSASEFLNEPIEYLLTPVQGMAKYLDSATYSSPSGFLKAQYQLFFPEQEEARPDDPQWCSELGNKLKRHLLFNNLLRILGRQPLSLDEVSDELARTLPAGEARDAASALLDSLCALIAIAKNAEMQPLVNLRLQLWVRELRRMVSPLHTDPNMGDGYYRLGFSDDLKADDAGLYLPVVQCNQCHTTAWLSRRPKSSAQIQTDLRAIYNDFFRQDPQSQVVLPLLADEEAPASEGRVQLLCTQCGQIQTEGDQCMACGEEALQRVFLPNLVRERKVAGVPRLVSEKNCPVCEQQDALLVFGARSASLSSVAIHHAYATPFNDDKKLIAFSDSVQDAAHLAGFFAARTWQNNIRMAIAQALPKGGMALVDFWRHLPRYWLEKRLNPEAMGRVRFVVEFIAPNMQYFEDYGRLKQTGEFPEGSDLITQVSKRLVWEVLAEFGYRASIGRSLERTGVAALGVDMGLVTDAVEKLLTPLREQEGLSEISETGLRQFLLGLLFRLKQRGAIYHRFLDSFIEKGGESFELHRISFLPDFFRQSHAPVFLIDAPKHSRFDCLISDRGKSGYQRWFEKCLGAEQLLLPEQADSAIYSRVLVSLVEVGLLLTSEHRGQTVWGLNPKYLYISPDVLVFKTPEARDRLFVPLEIAGWVEGLPSLAANDPGSYQAAANKPSWLAHLYGSGEIRRVIAEEHTGLLQRDERQEIEQAFMDGSQPWQPNLLSATPTLEMGIDIGDLSSLLLCSVPPAQANYLQRIGRAGRRDGNAFSLTLAAGAPHDLYFYADPLQMIAGRIEPPGVFLNASAVISRQLTAYCMDRWVATGLLEDAIPRRLKPVLDSVKKGEIHHFPFNYLAFVKGQAIPLLDGFFDLFRGELTDATKEYLRQFILGEGDSEGLEMRLVKRLHGMVIERDGFKKQIDQLKRHLDRLTKLPEDDATLSEMEEVERERGALQAMLRRLNGRQALNFLTDEGVIPNYAFPEEGVTLRSVIYRRKQTVQEGDRKYENLVYEYERPGAAAISELVPRNRFYAGGRQVAISQVDVDLSELESWRFCPSCSFTSKNTGQAEVTDCPRCGDPMWSDSGQAATMLRLKQVMANTSDRDSRIGDDSDDRASRFFNKQLLVDISPQSVGPAYRIVNDERPFGFEFVRSATFREINFGEFGLGTESAIAGELLARTGFSLCKHCGMVQEAGKGPQKHSHICPVGRKQLDDEENLVECLYLYREFASEAVRILLPVFASEGADRLLNSFIAALQLGLKLKFGGQVDHLRVMTYSEPVAESDSRRRYLMLYDSVPGGTGYLQDLMQSPQALVDVFRLAYERMTACSCNQELEKDGCYRCLYAYRNSYGMETTSRTAAVEMLGWILDDAEQFEVIESIADIQVNPVFESELEKLFISSLAKPNAIDVPVKIQQQVVNGKPGYFLTVGRRFYTIEPQVMVGEKEGVILPSKPDFLICSVDARDEQLFLPIAVFLDGYKYHKNSVAADSAKRLSLTQSGRYRVWSLTWDDVQGQYAGKLIKSRNPFAEGLHSEMQSVQNGLLQHLDIHALFKVALLPSIAQLLKYLSDPSTDAWKGLAFVRMLGWFDQTRMRDELVTSAVQRRIRAKSPTSLVEWMDDMSEVACCRFGGDNDLLEIDCIVPLEAISGIQPDLSLCNIWLDDRETGDDVFKSAWQAFLKAFNLLQFLPWSGFSSAKGISAGVYEAIAFNASKTISPADVSIEVGGLLEDVLESILPALTEWLSQGSDAPTVGFEFQNDEGEVVAEAELAWPEYKVAGLLEEQAEFDPLFLSVGWQVVRLDEKGNWVSSHPLNDLIRE